MSTDTAGIAATTLDTTPAEDRIEAAARHLYEVGLHAAHQSHVDAWIAAASDKLHQAVVEHLTALAEQQPTP